MAERPRPARLVSLQIGDDPPIEPTGLILTEISQYAQLDSHYRDPRWPRPAQERYDRLQLVGLVEEDARALAAIKMSMGKPATLTFDNGRVLTGGRVGRWEIHGTGGTVTRWEVHGQAGPSFPDRVELEIYYPWVVTQADADGPDAKKPASLREQKPLPAQPTADRPSHRPR